MRQSSYGPHQAALPYGCCFSLDEAGLWIASEKALEHDERFEAGEARPNAQVRPVPETDVFYVFAEWIKDIRLRNRLSIMIRGRETDQNRSVRGNAYSLKSHLVGGETVGGQEERWIMPQRLFDEDGELLTRVCGRWTLGKRSA